MLGKIAEEGAVLVRQVALPLRLEPALRIHILASSLCSIASGFHDLVQAQPGRQDQLTIGGLTAIAHLSETGFLGGEGEGVFQVGQFGGTELAWAIHEHDGPLTEQVLALVNVLDDPGDGTNAVLAALGLHLLTSGSPQPPKPTAAPPQGLSAPPVGRNPTHSATPEIPEHQGKHEEHSPGYLVSK